MAPSADNIATFVEVVRRHNLSAAARALGLPKSTVSRRLMRLEQQLEAKLLHRDARRITLTPVGRKLFDSAVTAIDALDAAVSELTESQTAPRGAIRLTAPADLGRMVLAPIFVAFLERYPEIELELLFTNRMVDLVEEGVDLAVRAGRVTKPELFARKLCESELQLAGAAKQAARLAPLDDPRQLESLPFVLYRTLEREQPLRLERGQGKRARAVEVRVSGRLSVDDYGSMAELVAAGMGLGFMPSVHVQEGVAAGRLVRVLPDWSSRSAHIYLVSSTRQPAERVRLLSDFLVQSFAGVHSV